MQTHETATTPDPFDSAIVTESTAVAPAARDAAGKFASTSVDAPETKPDEPELKQDAAPVEDKPKGKPRNDPEARISQAIARQKDAERRAADAERRARELEAKAATPPAPAAPPQQATRFPRFDEWSAAHADKTHDDYLDARDEWRDARRDSEQREQADLSRKESAFANASSKFSATYADAAKADPDLANRIDQKFLTAKPLSMLTASDKKLIAAIPDKRERDAFAFLCFLADQWIDSDHALGLLEHLSEPETFQRLATLPPDRVIRELAKVEAGFPAAQTKESRGPAGKPPVSHAQPPIKPLGGAQRVPDADEASDDEPIEAFIRRENAKDRKAGR